MLGDKKNKILAIETLLLQRSGSSQRFVLTEHFPVKQIVIYCEFVFYYKITEL